ncbi:MAG: IS110 family transposase [Actinomycetota bacterium]|nr:IS110 family transposase [Actinomycetota bacterium]
MIFVGDDWAEDHHDVAVMDEAGKVLARRRLPEGVAGVAELHELLAGLADDPGEVVVGIETDRGLWVASLVGAGYGVYALNPLAVARYRERHVTSGAKSDPGDAAVLADVVRTDRHHHREIAGDSEAAQAMKVVARAHQRVIWDRQRQVNRLRSTLREFFPAALEAFGTDLDHPDALGVLGRAPTPALAATLSVSSIGAALRKAGRQRNIEPRAKAIQAVLRGPRLDAPTALADAYGAQVRSAVAVIAEMTRQIAVLEAEVARDFESHPDAKIVRSLPGLGTVLGARVLGEFGDDPERYADGKARRNYAGTSPVTRASGKKRAVLARFIRNRHLADACYQWAFCATNTSPGARAFYDEHRAKGESHDQALRVLSNRLVGILDGCLRNRSLYDEDIAWGHRAAKTEPATAA